MSSFQRLVVVSLLASVSSATAAPVPDGALGIYFDEAERSWLILFRQPKDGRLFAASRSELFGVAEQSGAAGWTLRALGKRDRERGGAAAEATMTLVAPGPEQRSWQLRRGRLSLHREDPFLVRLMSRRSPRTLALVDDRTLRTRAMVRHDLDLLRDPDGAKRESFAANLDPAFVAARGGTTALVVDDLRGTLEEAAQALPGAAQTRLAQFRSVLDGLDAGHGALWPAADDTALLELLNPRGKPTGVIVLEDGGRAHLNRAGSPCVFGVLLPASESGDRPPSPIAPPPKGTLAVVPFLFYALGTSENAECSLTLDEKRVYEPQRGTFPLRLFADTSEIVGAQIVGYMNSQLFVAEGGSASDLTLMEEAQARELSRQAE